MLVKAKVLNSRLSAQKARLVADQVRGKSVSDASLLLQFSVKKAAKVIKKVLDSAVSNAESNHGMDVDVLRIQEIYVNEGPRLKRMHARAKGRGSRIQKPSCHVTLVVTD